jgi:hypothetical protein
MGLRQDIRSMDGSCRGSGLILTFIREELFTLPFGWSADGIGDEAL